MANTYTQIYIHVVFAIKYREASISHLWKERLHKYITGIIRNKGHKLIAINTMPDHVHIFIGMKPDESLSDLVRDIKRDSTNFVNQEIKPRVKFQWQEGFGAFSYSHSQIDSVVNYIIHQEEHHQKQTFREEYETLLKKFSVDYEPRYAFHKLEPES